MSAVPPPNGFFINDLIWYDLPRGDAMLVKGYELDMLDISGAAIDTINQSHSAISNLLYAMPQGMHMQSQWSVTSDYRDALQSYHEKTQDKATNSWTRFNREELFHRLTDQQNKGILRREKHILWFSKRVSTPISKVLTTSDAVQKHLNVLLTREHGVFENLHRTLQQSLGAFAKVNALNSAQNFLGYRNFLNPSLSQQDSASALHEFDEEASIQSLVFRSDGIDIKEEHAAFHFGGHYHALFVISRWPSRIRPLDVTLLTRLPFNDYTITTNVIPKDTREEIAKEEKMIIRLEGEFGAFKNRSLLTSKAKKEAKVDELSRGFSRLYSTLQIIRVWDKTLDGLITKSESIKAAISDLGAQYYHASRHSTAKNLFFQTWPGVTWAGYRGYDLETSNFSLAALLPFTSTFTGHLKNAEVIFHGSSRNLVGMRLFAGSTPQHALIVGGSGAGKSVLMNALLTQTQHEFHRTVIIEEGFSYATYTQTLGVKPIVLQLDGELTINYFDTNGLPLTHHHIAMAASLCLKMVGFDTSESVNKQRLGQLGEYISQIYTDAAEDYLMAHEAEIPEMQQMGYCIERHRSLMPPGSTILDAYLEIKQDSVLAEKLKSVASLDDVLQWANTADGVRLTRDLVFSKWDHEDYRDLTHHTLFMALRYSRFAHHDEKEINYLADMLGAWTREIGQRGKFFDGISNISLDTPVLHFELSLIPESAKDFKEAAGFLLNNVVRHAIMTDPRSWKKRIIFEEAPRFFNVPGAEEIVASSYATYRKYACWLATVCQQLSQIPPAIRPVLIGNSIIKIVFRQKSNQDLELLRNELKMPEATIQTIHSYPSPEHLPANNRFSSCTYWAEESGAPINGTIRVYASAEMLYLSSSDGDVFEARAKALANYKDTTEGILNEVAKARSQAA